jgi:hypothetical protein
MEEIRHNESYKSIRKPKINQSHQESEGQEKVVLPFRIYLESFRETQTQIFAYEDRSRWFEFILKRLRVSLAKTKNRIFSASYRIRDSDRIIRHAGN